MAAEHTIRSRRRREPEELERRAAQERLLDAKSVVIGLVIFALLVGGAYLWRFRAADSSKKVLEEFEFALEEPDLEDFDLKEPQREILQEQIDEVFQPQEDMVEERPDIQISTDPVEAEVTEEVIQTDAVEVVQDIAVEFAEMEILDAPEDVTEFAEDVTAAIQPIAAPVPTAADIFRYDEPTPAMERKLDLVTRAPSPGKPFQVEPQQFGELEAPTVGEPGPVSVNLFGDGDDFRMMGGFGGIEARNAVDMALRWLALHQEPGGYWVSRKWDPEDVDENGLTPEEQATPEDVNPERDRGSQYNLGVTSLASLAFMGGGHTVRKGEYRANVRRALEWMFEPAESGNRPGGKGEHVRARDRDDRALRSAREGAG